MFEQLVSTINFPEHPITFMGKIKQSLIGKLGMTLIGPVLTYGLYYYDYFSDLSLMITLFINCHYYYGITSIVIMVLSYVTSAIFLKFKMKQEFKESLLYPYYHSKNLFLITKENILAIVRGKTLPEESDDSIILSHYITFLETITESVPQLCLQIMVLREFGLSKDLYERFNQTTGLCTSLISICLLFGKVSYSKNKGYNFGSKRFH